jgi:hypothetical protein
LKFLRVNELLSMFSRITFLRNIISEAGK